MRMAVSGVVVCGGRSQRMGLDKATLPFGPETMLARVVRLLQEVVDPVVVVAAEDQVLPKLPEGVVVARDNQPGCGPMAGLTTGLKVLAPHAELIYASSCDVPLLVPQFVTQLVNLCQDRQAVVPLVGNRWHPLAAVYRRDACPVAARLLQERRLRLYGLVEQLNARRVRPKVLKRADPELLSLRNCNRPPDYLAALADAGFQPPQETLAQLVVAHRPQE